MKSSNPVLGKLTERENRNSGFGMPGYEGVETDGSYPPGQVSSGAMTVDDVVVRTASLLGLVGLTAALSWILIPLDSPLVAPLMIGAGLSALGMFLFMMFKQVTNPWLISAYVALQGLVIGLFSKSYADAFGGGIVLQAVVATFAVFFGMAWLYKSRVIRATSRFKKWMMGALIGAFALISLNFILALVGVNDGQGIGLRSGGTFSIIMSLVFIGIASLSFILDFDSVEQGVAYGLPRKYAWYCAFGIVLGLVWLYLEILRFLGYMRD